MLPCRSAFEVAGHSFSIATDDAALRDQIDECFASLRSPRPIAPERWEIRQQAGRLVLLRDSAAGLRERPTSAGGVITLVQTEMNAIAVERGCSAGHLLVHAGALTMEGVTVLLVGTSGAGKSTLTSHLVARGAGYLSDEFAILDVERKLTLGYPKPIAVKPGAFGLLREIGLAPSSERPEFKHTRWHVPVPADAVRREAAWPQLLVILDRQGHLGREPERMHPADALLELAEHSPCRAQTTEQFPLLADLARHTPAHRIGRAHPAEMVATVHELAAGFSDRGAHR